MHLKSADAIDDPAIDPKFLLVDFDITMQTEAGRTLEAFFREAPLGDVISERYLPDRDVLPYPATDAQCKSFIQGNCKFLKYSRGFG